MGGGLLKQEIMKTAREWFEKLRPDLRDRAISYTVRAGCSEVSSSFSYALRGAFLWSETVEGYGFWNEIYEEALDIEEGRKPDIKPKNKKR